MPMKAIGFAHRKHSLFNLLCFCPKIMFTRGSRHVRAMRMWSTGCFNVTVRLLIIENKQTLSFFNCQSGYQTFRLSKIVAPMVTHSNGNFCAPFCYPKTKTPKRAMISDVANSNDFVENGRRLHRSQE